MEEEVDRDTSDFQFYNWAVDLKLPQKVIQQLQQEELVTKEALLLIEESDLKALGLPLGCTKLIMRDIQKWKGGVSPASGNQLNPYAASLDSVGRQPGQPNLNLQGGGCKPVQQQFPPGPRYRPPQPIPQGSGYQPTQNIWQPGSYNQYYPPGHGNFAVPLVSEKGGHGQVPGRRQKQQKDDALTDCPEGWQGPNAAQHVPLYANSSDDAMPEFVSDEPRWSNQAFSKGQYQPDVPSRQLKGKDDLKILLAGETGSGKSTTGNSLLGITREDGFYAETSIQSVTKVAKSKTNRRFGRNIQVVDTPGLFDTSCEDGFVYEQLADLIGMSLPGFNAIFLVIRKGRFSHQLVKTIEIFFKFFGTGVSQYSFVIFTHFKSQAKFQNHIRNASKNPTDKGTEAFEYLKTSCQHKMFFINNKADKRVKDEMVWDILNAVEEANDRAEQPYFQNKHTEMIKKKAEEFFRTQICRHGAERSKEDLRILLVGLPGHGKSATGNSLMGNNMFIEKPSQFGEQDIQCKDGKIYERHIRIVEFPMNSNQSDATIRQLLLQAEKMLHPGFHAICFIVNPYKTSEVKIQFQRIMEFFEDLASDYAFVLMTYTKTEEECERHVPTKRDPKDPGITSVFRFCKDKALFMDNKASPKVKEEMQQVILTYIDSSNAGKPIPHFSSRFKDAAEAAEAKHQEQLRMQREAFEAYAKEIERKQAMQVAQAKRNGCTIL